MPAYGMEGVKYRKMEAVPDDEVMQNPEFL
jgi:hypothetical protein